MPDVYFCRQVFFYFFAGQNKICCQLSHLLPVNTYGSDALIDYFIRGSVIVSQYSENRFRILILRRDFS